MLYSMFVWVFLLLHASGKPDAFIFSSLALRTYQSSTKGEFVLGPGFYCRRSRGDISSAGL